jgi:PEP-CTERM motif
MKHYALPVVALAVFGMVGAAPSFADTKTNQIVNGDFNTTPALAAGNWGDFSNGTVAGWTGSAGLIEIDTAGAIGPGINQFSSQSLEVNANSPETVTQTITGLTVGQTYVLQFAYGDRPTSGDESMSVLLNGVVITTEVDNFFANTPSLVWHDDGYAITASSTTETLSFEGLSDSGQPSFGNEVTDVALIATPEPSTWLLMLSGIGLLGFAAWRRSGTAMPNPSAL